MKKIFTVILAVAVAAAMSVSAFALVDQDSTEANDSMSVVYTVAPTYTVTIPTEVTLGDEVTVKAENVVVPKGKQVEVSISGENGFKVATAEGAELTYTVMKGETPVLEGETVLAVNPTDGNTGSVKLSFVAPTEIQYAGRYTGTAIFTVAVKDANEQISFSIDNPEMGVGQFTANAGMTWAEWIESSAEAAGYYTENGSEFVFWGEDGWYVLCAPGAELFWEDSLSPDDVIENGVTYVLLIAAS